MTESVLPEGWHEDNRGLCRSCGARIIWATHNSGNRAPFNLDGVSHFATCPQGNEWRHGRQRSHRRFAPMDCD
jgi:hypothetical protein